MEETEAARLTEGMMNRVCWFSHLCIIFDQTKKGKNSAIKADFLSQLLAYQSVYLN